MPIAAFLGQDPRHPPTERAHRTQTVDLHANEARRMAVWRGIGPIPPALIITLDANGNPTHDSRREMELLGLTPPPAGGNLRSPGANLTAIRLAIPPSALPAAPPPPSDPFTIHMMNAISPGFTVQSRSATFFFPVRLKEMSFVVHRQEVNGAGIRIFIRPGTDTTFGFQDGDVDLHNYDAAGANTLINTPGRFNPSARVQTLNRLITTVPFFIGIDVNTNGNVQVTEFDLTFLAEFVGRAGISEILPPPKTTLQLTQEASNPPRPPATVYITPPGGPAPAPAPAAAGPAVRYIYAPPRTQSPAMPNAVQTSPAVTTISNWQKIQVLAAQLRERPVRHDDLVAAVASAGLPPEAVNMVQAQATKPPNLQLQADLLGSPGIPVLPGWQPGRVV